MKTFEYTIKDSLGIHARPAGLLVKLAKSVNSTITITKGEKTVDISKMIALMGLGVKCGDHVVLNIEGEDEEAAFAEVEKFMTENL